METLPCYKPMLAIPWSINHETGKVQYKFTRRLIDTTDLSEVEEVEGKFFKRKAIPCGQCVGCRLDYAKQWAIRCVLEMQDYDPYDCYFLTCTYDDDHVPIRFYSPDKQLWERENFRYNPITGTFFNSFGDTCSYDELVGLCSRLRQVMSLDFRDLTLFLKRLRKSQSKLFHVEIRFYACGEYGSKTKRPHFHLIVYGLKLDEPDSRTWRKVSGGYYVWEDKYLESIWKNGNVIVGRVTFNSCEYVARYMLKKFKGKEREFYDTFNLVPEQSRMSRMPGLGSGYYDKFKKVFYETDQIALTTEKGAKIFKPPKFFDKMYKEESPDLYALLSEDREWNAFVSMIDKEHSTGLPISEVLDREEQIRRDKIKILNDRSVKNG